MKAIRCFIYYLLLNFHAFAQEGKSQITHLKFSPDGCTIVVSRTGNIFEVYDTSGNQLDTFSTELKLPKVVFPSYNFDGSVLAVGNTIKNTKSKMEIAKIPFLAHSILFSPIRNQYIVYGYNEQRTEFFSEKGKRIKLSPFSKNFDYLTFGKDGKNLVAYQNGILALINPLTKTTHWKKQISNKMEGKECITFSDDSKKLAYWKDSMLHVLNAQTGELIYYIKSGEPTGLEFSPDGKYLAVGFIEKSIVVQVYSIVQRKELYSITTKLYPNKLFTTQNQLITLDDEHYVVLTNVDTKKQKRLPLIGRGYQQLYLTKDAKRLLLIDKEKNPICYWNLETEKVKVLEKLEITDIPAFVVFDISSDGKRLVFADRLNGLIVFDLENGNVIKRF